MLRRPCDLDLLVFFVRHPRTLMASELTCRISSDQSLLENGADLRGPAFSDHYESESAAVVIARRAYSLGLSPLRAR